MTKRVYGAAGVPPQNQLDLRSIQPGKTSRDQVAQKLAWADTGIHDPRLFFGRWASSGSGWIWAVGTNSGGNGGTNRHWAIHNYLVEFDEAGLVKSAREVPSADLVPALQHWVDQSHPPALQLSTSVSLNGSLSDNNPVQLILSADSLEFQDARQPKHNFRIARSKISAITSGSDPKIKDAVFPPFIGLIIAFSEKTPKGKVLVLRLRAQDLLTLLEYVPSGGAPAPAS